MKKIIRFLKLQKYKIFRIKDFPESVAIGIAWGASVSVTPALGFHLISCYLGTWIMRGNLIAATVGTIVGNPWTFPFFFYLDYKIGVLFLFDEMDSYELKLKFLFENFDKLFLPTFVGSIPIAIVVWLTTYYITKNLLKKRLNEKKNKTRR
tara:strand:+ start:375 stop:827 length:453 start_codon:yes stop_codon:yes gene_type:complete